MSLTPYELHRLAPFLEEWNAGVERARASYEAMPIASGVPGSGPDRCEWGDCDRKARAGGLCTRHYRADRRRQGKQGAA